MGQYGLRAKEGRDIVIIMIALGTVSVISVILRIIARRMRDVRLGLEDYFMMIAACLVVASTIIVITTVTRGGVGLHVSQVDPLDIEYVLQMIIPCQILYGIGLSLIKTSMMVLFLKLFGTKLGLRITIYITGAIVWGWALSIVLESFLICTPIGFNWNPMVPGGRCGDRNAAFVAAGVLNMVTDSMVMALPLKYVWELQLPVGRKIGLSVAFCIGLFVTAISMVRVSSLTKINFNDITYTLPIPLMWSIIEQQLAVVGANIPHLRRVFSRVFPRHWLGSSGRRSANPLGEPDARNGSQQIFPLIRMDTGVGKSEIRPKAAAGRRRQAPAAGWTEDGWSDTELAPNAAPPDGIRIWKSFHVQR